MRVRLFELRLLAVALTVLWAAGGGIVLIGYRPGGPWDLLVGVTAALPLLVAVAPIVWPPLVTSNRGAAGVFWIGLVAGLLLVPSIAAVTAQVLARSSEPLLPSAEVVYPWAVALLATSLFAGLGVSRQLISEAGLGRRRLAASVGFALVTTTFIGAAFAGASLADDAALRDKPAAYSRFGPTSPTLTPPQCDEDLQSATTAQLELDVWGNVDNRSIGSVDLTGQRSGSDVYWTAQVVRSDLFGQFGATRIGAAAWALTPGQGWQSVPPASLDSKLIDATAIAEAFSVGNRATAEDRGLEYVEGARGRHCRVAIDGKTFGASFPQVTWLVGDASLAAWRGEIDYWVFGDGEIGLISGSVNGSAQTILPHGLQATVEIKLTATDRGWPVSISPPRAGQ
ncbi:MAG: hypothetical protein ABSD62_06700 [Candidatus Limnocylindrales bacterium]